MGASAEGGGGGGKETQRRGTHNLECVSSTRLFLYEEIRRIKRLYLYVRVSVFQERQILEETVAPLNLSTLSKQPSQVEAISSAQQDSLTKTNAPTVLSHKVATITLDLEMEARDTPKQNNQRVPMMSEDQHGVSQLRFVQGKTHTHTRIHTLTYTHTHKHISYQTCCISADASWENERKQELWKTSSLDRNAQLIQPSTVKRCVFHRPTLFSPMQLHWKYNIPPTDTHTSLSACTSLSAKMWNHTTLIHDPIVLTPRA